MKQKYYYAQLMTDKRKRSYANKVRTAAKRVLALSGFAVDPSMSLSHPFIRGCEFRYNEMELYRLQDLNDTMTIPYSEIKWIDFFVVARRWAGGGVMMSLNIMYNFDLVVHLEDGSEMEVELPAEYSFRSVIGQLNTANVPVIDQFDVFGNFPDERTFKKEFVPYFQEHYSVLAMENGLEDPRVAFNPM